MTSIANRLRYSIDESSAAHVAQHLFKCADSFVPPLSVDIVEYAKKIRKHASTLEAWVDEELAGLVAVYTNTPPTAFITNVSVVRIYSGQGIGRRLLDQSIRLAQENGCLQIDLMVNRANEKALRLYGNIGFTQKELAEPTIILRKPLVNAQRR